MQRQVNIEYAIVQGFYWMSFCASSGFAVIFLQSRGYTNTQLGMILGAAGILGFLLPQALAAWIDRSERITSFHCLTALLIGQTAAVLALMLLPGRSFAVSLLYFLFLAFAIAVNPLNTEMSAELEQAFGHINYGAARSVGSLAFAPAAVLLGRLVERQGSELLLTVDLICIALQAAILLVLGLRIRREGIRSAGAAEKRRTGGTVAFIRSNLRFMMLLLGLTLIFFYQNLVVSYMINVVRSVGGDTSDMGVLNGYMALLEVPVMFLYDRLARRFGCSATMRFGAIMFACKAIAFALARSMPMLWFACTLQMLSLAIVIPAMVRYVNLYIDRKDSAKGQALAYGTVTVGSVLSSSLGGALFDSISTRATLFVAAAVTVAGMVICLLFTERRSPAEDAGPLA